MNQENNLKITVHNPKGTYTPFPTDIDPLWKDYPLKGVTYLVDYGFIDGHIREDGGNLDVFVGEGDINGYIKIWRCDTPIETKFIKNVTKEEWEAIISQFKPVIKESECFASQERFVEVLKGYKK